MGRVADQNADFSIITSDNPRKEDPDAIIAEVEKGFRSDHYEKIADRAKAIARAIALAQPRDIVLIAGKGHEAYQEFADHTVPFDDIQVARRALGKSSARVLNSWIRFHLARSPNSPAARSRPAMPTATITRVSTDSRTLQPGDCSSPLRGENFDGHKFVEQAVERGAAGAMVEENWKGTTPPEFRADSRRGHAGRLIRTLRCELSALRCRLKVIAITGSNGKTSTKDFVAPRLWRGSFRVTKTEGNFNNHVGLPQTMLARERRTTKSRSGKSG